MGAPEEARARLAKAGEFLDAARADRDQKRFNAAASNAVIAGVNAKDAICLTLTGRTRKGDDHEEAVAELARAGQVGREFAPTLRRLLRVKTKAQYQAAPISAAAADRAVEHASHIVEAARRTVTS